MDQPTPHGLAGVKDAVLVAGFFGALLSIAYAKPATKWQAAIGLITGAAVAYYGTPVAMHTLKEYMPAELSPCMAFFLGFIAHRAVPAALALVDRLRDIKLPFLG